MELPYPSSDRRRYAIEVARLGGITFGADWPTSALGGTVDDWSRRAKAEVPVRNANVVYLLALSLARVMPTRD